jgi:hypothetical protein
VPGGVGDNISVSENDVEVLIRSISLPDVADDGAAAADDDSIDDDIAGGAVIYNSRELPGASGRRLKARGRGGTALAGGVASLRKSCLGRYNLGLHRGRHLV